MIRLIFALIRAYRTGGFVKRGLVTIGTGIMLEFTGHFLDALVSFLRSLS